MSQAVRLTSLSHGGGCGCKIAPDVLQSIMQKAMPFTVPSAQLLVGKETADDAAVYLLNEEQALIATTDFFMPIVDDPEIFGKIAATNAISDVYAMGGTPIMALAIVGMPVQVLGEEVIAKILQGGASVCQQAGIPIAGGHTIDSVEPIYGLVVLGLAHPQHIKRNCSAQLGDDLILAKPLGVGIYSAALKKEQLSAEDYAQMVAATTLLNRPGAALGAMPAVHALTDVTGFGLLGHSLEIARGSQLNITLSRAQIPALPNVYQYIEQGFKTGASARNWSACAAEVDVPAAWSSTEWEPLKVLLTDPQTAGGLLIACDPQATPAILDLLHTQGFADAQKIGTCRAGQGVSLRDSLST